MTIAVIALGANLGQPLATLRDAVSRLAQLGQIVAISPVYETDPVGYTDQPVFLNAVLSLETGLPADTLLHHLHDIETRLGRLRSFANAPRTIDLDLLFLGNEIWQSPELTLPHPRFQERAFVLVPLADIAPDLIDPRSGQSVRALLAALPDRTGVRPTRFSLE